MATPPTTDTREWLAVLYKADSIPLARSVPISIYGDSIKAVVASMFDDGSNFYVHGAAAEVPGLWRVDLSDPQGFAYALRWLYQRDDPHPSLAIVDNMAAAWLDGPTDADRLLLAEALVDAVRS